MTIAANREFALVAACCLWPASPDRDAAIVAAVSESVDWARFLQVTIRHRVAGLVWHGLCRAGIEPPKDIARSLKALATGTVQAGLALCAETIRLQRAFDQAGLDCAFIKGGTLAVLAYGNLGIRHAKDIDMVVPDAELAATCELLAGAGYRRTRPSGTISEAQLALWRVHGKDMEWRHERSGIQLELHWRLSDISFFRNDIPDFSKMRPVEVMPTVGVMTLPPPELFTYLCVHGAVHAWCRLKWLADVHALIADAPEAVIEGHYRFAAAKGVERAVGQALLLCAQIFGLRLPAGLATILAASRATRLLACAARFIMMRGGAEIEIYDAPFGTTLVSATHLLLAANVRQFAAEAYNKLVNLDDVALVPLPSSLSFLYIVLRVPLWLFRRCANIGASPRPSKT